MTRWHRLPVCKLLIALAFVLLLLAPAKASAHLPGQAPFFKVNDTYIILYHIQNPDLSTFPMPQTNTADNYLVGSEISFKLETHLMPVSPEAIARSEFKIDFGDGTTFAGAESTHTYGKIGSYIVNVYADDGGGSQLIESVIVHIVPDQAYKLPVPVIKLNGQKADNPAKTYKADFADPVSFDARASTASGSTIVGYWWDFADGKGATGSVVEHTYSKDRVIASPVLRVRDANGFIVDTVADVANAAKFGGGTAAGNGTGGDNFIAAAYQSFNQRLKLTLGDVFTGDGMNYGLAALALGFAVVAGSLHSVTPGHGKSVMAALMIGRRRSKWSDVIIVASAITLTHTVVIFGLGFAFLGLNATFSLANVVGYFEKLSAVLIMLLASWLIYSGVRKIQRRRHHGAQHVRGDDHEHEHQHSHNHPEAKDFSKVDSKWGLFLAGASGGIVPCVDALSLLLLAVSLGYVAFGLFLVFAFSLGLAASIIAIGLILLAGKHKLKADGRLVTFADVYAPLISGVVIFLIAASLLFT